jgi:hypothetical protein
VVFDLHPFLKVFSMATLVFVQIKILGFGCFASYFF